MATAKEGLEDALQQEIEETKKDLQLIDCVTAESKLAGTQDFVKKAFCENQFLHLVDLNCGVCPMVIQATVTFKDMTSGPVLSTQVGRLLASGWGFILLMLLTFCFAVARPEDGQSDHGKRSPCSGDAPEYQRLVLEMLFLSFLLLTVFASLHSTPASLLQKTMANFDAMIVILSALRFAMAKIMVYHFRAKHCLVQEVGTLDRVHRYIAGLTGFILCMLPVFIDPLRVPRGVKVFAYLLVLAGMVYNYVLLLHIILEEDKFPEYHEEEPVQLWIQPLKPLDHLMGGFSMVIMFYARAFFWQVIMGEDFTLLRGRFRLAI